jgi:hypothetical protein
MGSSRAANNSSGQHLVHKAIVGIKQAFQSGAHFWRPHQNFGAPRRLSMEMVVYP